MSRIVLDCAANGNASRFFRGAERPSGCTGPEAADDAPSIDKAGAPPGSPNLQRGTSCEEEPSMKNGCGQAFVL